MRARAAVVAVLLAAARLPASPAGAAYLGGPGRDLVVPGPDLSFDRGVACDDPAVQGFPTVILGHFTGGYSHYVGEGGPIVLDWRDEKLCFPSNRSCNHYISEMRRDFHRPEGYFTCLPLR